jgi:hypothetical protein
MKKLGSQKEDAERAPKMAHSFGEEKTFLFLPGFKDRTVSTIA